MPPACFRSWRAHSGAHSDHPPQPESAHSGAQSDAVALAPDCAVAGHVGADAGRGRVAAGCVCAVARSAAAAADPARSAGGCAVAEGVAAVAERCCTQTAVARCHTGAAAAAGRPVLTLDPEIRRNGTAAAEAVAGSIAVVGTAA